MNVVIDGTDVIVTFIIIAVAVAVADVVPVVVPSLVALVDDVSVKLLFAMLVVVVGGDVVVVVVSAFDEDVCGCAKQTAIHEIANNSKIIV